MILQDRASLNPRMSVGDFIGEPMKAHGLASRDPEMHEQVKQASARVALNPKFTQRYPYEFSGGQHQRVVIARALAVNSFLIGV